MAKDPLEDQTVPTKKMAEQLSDILGCSGAHKVGDDAWGPCESPKDLKKLIELGNPAFREWKKRQQKKKNLEEFLELKAKGKSKRYFDTRAAAEKAATNMGCVGAHQSRQGVWSPCMTPEDFNAAHAHLSVGGSPALRLKRPVRRVATNNRVWKICVSVVHEVLRLYLAVGWCLRSLSLRQILLSLRRAWWMRLSVH